MPNPSRQARSLSLSTYSCEHPHRNSLLSLPLSCLSASVKHSWYPVQMTSISLNQNLTLHNPVLSTQISTPTLTAIALINSSYEYRWNEGNQLTFSFFLVNPFTELCYRYYANTNGVHWPPEVQDYNKRFTKMLEHIKSRHDPTVTTVAQGVLEWKRSQNARHIGLDIQAWLDRFYLSRIGIRFLIGQRAFFLFNAIYSNP